MSYDVAGKRVLVTGGSSGIGAGLAEAMARAGATVGICARRRDRLESVLERCREHVPASAMWVVDLAEEGAAEQLATDVTEAFGGVDVLVNNAGIPKRRHVTRLDTETVDAVMRINYTAPVHLTLALLPQMLERGEGRVVNVSSVAAHLSSPGEAAYSASKAALAVFSETLALDLWDTGVRSMVVYPGVVDTELFTLPDNDPSLAAVDALTVDEAVSQIMAALADDAVEVYVPGWFADVVTGKVNDLGAFLAGAAAWVRQQQAGSGPS
ncbi:MAG: SDR family NAD(P)-dependent oxidoreductase [Acidimicrobiales bacterium]